METRAEESRASGIRRPRLLLDTRAPGGLAPGIVRPSDARGCAAESAASDGGVCRRRLSIAQEHVRYARSCVSGALRCPYGYWLVPRAHDD